MPSPRRCLAGLAIGALLVASCGDVEPRSTTAGRARVTGTVTDDRHTLCPNGPPRCSTPDVRGALTALSQVVGVMFPPTTLPPVTTPPTTAAPETTESVIRSWPSSFQPCGGAYPPCSVVENESGGDYGAYNPGGCGGRGCFGKWQFSGEWACRLGLPCDLASATPQQQDEAARILWNGGAGCSNWSAC